MKKIQIMGWLVMAAAFITTFTACSSDENNDVLGGTPVEPVRTVSVTVGAGITDDATTRSAIIDGTNNQGKATHTLKFTEGDRLFVQAMYGTYVQDELYYEYYEHVLSGFLTMNDGSLSDDYKSASFSGTLKQYNRVGESYNYTAAGSISVTYTSDPLARGDNGAKKSFATLVHKDAIEGADYTDKGWDIDYKTNKLATNVNVLMTKYLTVMSSSEGTGYNSSTKSFNYLNDTGNTPILNCTISGLTANATYTVTYVIDGPEGDFDVTLSPEVTANGSGVATFAFFGDESSINHALKFVRTSPNETKTATLGKKNLGVSSMIFNVSRKAESLP